ncbi:serine/threonine-protein kinase [uncultured Desulfosarcina sp.]|uniref:CHASE2 domain-containing serine/threonine-protein kinase n=1 Tax=uncultured Desulfosarcina sp. TaxID=218289 RepID=UPI0029C63848|nr:serine/threonine-protein kinase [uncultured Desulfosarcina sp.]
MLKRILTTPLIQVVLLTALVLIAMVTSFAPWTTVENRNFDFWAGRVGHPQDLPIAVVAIDDRSIGQFGQWPWPRSRIAELLTLLSENDAAAVGLCLLYTQPDQGEGLAAVQELRSRLADPQWDGDRSTTGRIDELLAALETRLDQDASLIEAVRRTRNAVLPLYISMDPPAGDESADPSGLVVVNSLNPQFLPAAASDRQQEALRAIGAGFQGPPMGSRVIAPFADLAGKAGALGHLNLDEDDDGRVRRLPLLIACQGRLLPAFSLQLALKSTGTRLRDMSVGLDLFGQPRLAAGKIALIADDAYRILVTHDEEWTRQRRFSFAEIVNGEVDPAVFKDRIVLIGITAQPPARTFRMGLHDRPPEVEIMADALAGILSAERVSRPSWTRILEIGVVLYFATFLALVIPRVSLRLGAGILLIFLATWYAAAVGLLLGYGYKIEVMAPAALAVAGFLLLQFTLASRRMQAAQLEALTTQGLSYQGQGMLDMAHEKFMQCPVKDRSVKHLLYNLALDFERKRMFNKALDIYRHIRSAGNYKDVTKRIQRFAELDNTLVGGGRGEKPLMMAGGGAKPTFGRYEILQELGRGGMGTVYLGRDPKINREVAIKTLEYAEVEPAELPDVKNRFFREAESAGNLSHPNIVSIYDVGEEHDMAYIAMELLKGDNLTWVCIKGHLLPIPEVLGVMADVTAALNYAHTQGVIHRDIKPANIMRLEDGRVKVTDFSIAHVMDASQTRTGVVLGTPNYMSPEQVDGQRLDGRSDLFSLGIVLYEMLSGTKPFKGDSMSAVLYAIANSRPKPLAKVAEEIPPCVKTLVNKLLAKDRRKRYDSAADVAKAIDDCLKRL